MAWNDICDQEQAVRALRAHLARRRIAPAYLFVGPDGVGKRLAALEFTKAMNCDRGDGEGCGACGQCHRIEKRLHPDVHSLEPQGASQTIQMDDVRHLLGRIALRPYMGRRSVVIVNGAERLTEEAANSLLKALEEPPGQTTFLLLTINPAYCLPTIVSRCQCLRFQRLAPDTIAAWLVRHEQADVSAAHDVSRLARGSLSRARELIGRREADQRIRAQVEGAVSGASPAPMPPTDREELARWCEQTIGWLRDAAAGAVGEQGRRLDPDRCISAALECIAWTESLKEQFVSPRLVATLLRESWIELAR